MTATSDKLNMRKIWQDLKQNLVTLVGANFVFKIIVVTLLSPLVSLLYRLFLGISGRPVLADTEIAFFLLHPVGWLTAIVVGGAFLAVQALEQAALMSILLADSQQSKVRLLEILRFLANRLADLMRLTVRILARGLWAVAPFLIVGGVLYLILLTNHDINFYLSEKPPRFWLAVFLIGVDLVAMLAVLLRQIVIWAFAIQLLLFEKVSPQDALGMSRDRISGHQIGILKTIALWFVANVVFNFCLAMIVLLMGQFLLPDVSSPLASVLFWLVFILIVMIALHLISQLVANLSFSIVLTQLFLRFADESRLSLPTMNSSPDQLWLRRARIGLIAYLLIAPIWIGVFTVVGFNAIDREVDTQVTAHRGASGGAPENTLASIRLAIEQETDWVEIDVQESKDGVVVVAHDSDLKKVAGEDVKIWEATAEELRQIDIGSYFDPKYHEERVPTLEEVLKLCQGKVGLNIELKYYGHDQNLEQRVVDLVEKYDMQDHIMIMSLKLEGVRKIQELRPNWKVGLLTAVTMSDLTRVDVDFYAVKTTLATPVFIQQSHLRGKEVATWTVNDELTMATMVRRHADNLITDYPALAKKVVKQQSELSRVESVLFDFALLLGKNPLPDPEKTER